MAIVLLVFLSSTLSHIMAQTRPMERSYIRGGVLEAPKSRVVRDSLSSSDSLMVAVALDSLGMGSLAHDELALIDSLGRDTLQRQVAQRGVAAPTLLDNVATPIDSTQLAKKSREKFFSDSVSLSRMCWTAAILPGYGQIYNKQKWKLPILYSALAGSIALYVHENKTYKPLKTEYEALISQGLSRTEELNEVQGEMIRSNTRRQLYVGAAAGSYIYMLADAALNYATNDVSSVKRATTLATICPGAGQIYNKSYWKLPFVIGGFAAMIYVVDWNNRGYQRFSTAYSQVIAYDNDPDSYPNGSPDEFGGRYDADYLQSLRDSYRRNRDFSIIVLAGLYLLQLVDAHVDAQFKDFDISDDLSMNIEPAVGYSYSPTANRSVATYGFNVGFKF